VAPFRSHCRRSGRAVACPIPRLTACSSLPSGSPSTRVRAQSKLSRPEPVRSAPSGASWRELLNARTCRSGFSRTAATSSWPPTSPWNRLRKRRWPRQRASSWVSSFCKSSRRLRRLHVADQSRMAAPPVAAVRIGGRVGRSSTALVGGHTRCPTGGRANPGWSRLAPAIPAHCETGEPMGWKVTPPTDANPVVIAVFEGFLRRRARHGSDRRDVPGAASWPAIWVRSRRRRSHRQAGKLSELSGGQGPGAGEAGKAPVTHARVVVTHYGEPDALRVVEEECPEPQWARPDRGMMGPGRRTS
jgi:hypothetical protein